MPLVVRIKIFLLMIASAASATRVDIRGGFGERRPGLEYDTAAPLFDFNVLVTGVHTEGQSRRMAAASPNLVSRRCRWSCALVDHFENKCGATNAWAPMQVQWKFVVLQSWTTRSKKREKIKRSQRQTGEL